MGINRIVSTAHLSWFFVGFDLVLLPLLAREIGESFFPNIKPEVSILALYGTFSLSLLARFFGGIILGTAADSYGRKPIVIICLSVMSTLTLFSAFLPSVHDVTVGWALAVMISFITLRIVIGFFGGGIWPTAAVSAMEELEATFLRATKKCTRASAIMQSGYHTGHLIAAFISFGLLAALGVSWHGWPVTIWHNSFYSFKDAFTWRTLCFIGGVFGITWTIYFSNSEKNEQYRKIKSESPLRALLINEENKEYRDILFNFWLIITGLLYMYYSVIIILPEMLVRNDFLIPYHLSPNEAYPIGTILILVSTLGAHLWLGFFCHSVWKSGRSSISFRNIVCILMELRKFWCGLINKIANFIGIQYETREEATELDDDVIYKNVDIMIIAFIGFILIIFGILGGVSFYFLFGLEPESIPSKLILIYILVVFIMVAVSGWALIPSLLSSRFPKHFRATASNLAYNGGLAIGFASPFIMLENFLQQQQHMEWLIFFPAILAASAMIIGAIRLLLSINKKSKASGVGLPRAWGPYDA